MPSASGLQLTNVVERTFSRVPAPASMAPGSAELTPDEVAASYDRIAERWILDTFPPDNGIAAHERALAFLKHKRTALDVGCGANGRIIELLVRHGFAAEGLDLSSRMLELARCRHPDVTFHQADVCEWELPRRYDFISAWDSIWHVPLHRHEDVVGKLLRGLAEGGVCVLSAGGLDAAGEKADSAMGPPMYYSTLGVPRLLRLIEESGCVVRHLEYDQLPEAHIYVIAERLAGASSEG